MIQQDEKQEAARQEAKLSLSIRGRKVYLRGVEREDLAHRVKWINDPTIQRTLNFQYPMSVVKAEKWLQAVASEPCRRDFSICTIDGDHYIGFGGFLSVEMTVRKAELYIAIGDKKYWGVGGYGTDAYDVITRFGFLELGLNRIYGYQLMFNRTARKVIEKLGWSIEGVLRQDIFAHGELRDRTVVSILRQDWLKMNPGFNDLRDCVSED